MQNFQFRKKPIVIEAVQLTEGIMEQLMHGGHSQEIPGWLVKAFFRAPELPGSVQHAVRVLTINTLEGRMHAAPGDWIIRGVQGELYPCKADIFAATYEPAA
jgi:hypothetical protein